MATKNLARTIIEGGRASPNKRERNDSHREERAGTRAFLAKASALHEGFDALCVGKRTKVYKGFADKLGPPERWLRSQVGRPWSKVRSEIFARFNPRSLAGQHIIFDHLLRSVSMKDAHERWFGAHADLFVDRHGTLRCRKSRKRSRPRHWQNQLPVPDPVIQWLQDRRVCGEGSALFWQVQVRSCESCNATQRSPCCCPSVDGVVQHGAHLHYRQAQRLTREEVEFWLSLDQNLRDSISIAAKAKKALAPGGVFATAEFVADEERKAATMALLFSVAMLIWSNGGAAYTFSELTKILREGGFSDVSQHTMGDNPSIWVVGR